MTSDGWRPAARTAVGRYSCSDHGQCSQPPISPAGTGSGVSDPVETGSSNRLPGLGERPVVLPGPGVEQRDALQAEEVSERVLVDHEC
jgi:hypothetical protein